MQPGIPIPELRDKNRLARTYSETEANNFDADTGHRLFDDGRIRPSRTALPQAPHAPRLYARSHNSEFEDTYGLEDEYIPGLDFSAELLRWNGTPDALALVSREALYLDLKTLHAQVAPQPIGKKRKPDPRDGARDAAGDAPLSARGLLGRSLLGRELGRGGRARDMLGRLTLREQLARAGRARMPALGGAPALSPHTLLALRHSFDVVAAALPKNYADLPYSQRKRLVKQVAPAVDFAHFSAYSKSAGAAPGVRLRRGSTLMALRALALLLLAEVPCAAPQEPKENVDEKGARVLGHELGRIIGFGAWGTIRECTACDGLGAVRAVKIVKSVRDPDRAGGGPRVNAKVLAVFRQEIAIWAQTRHSNILPLLDHLETADAIFCLTERISGGTLFEVAAAWGRFNALVEATSGPLDFSLARQARRIEQSAQYARQIAAALRYLHHELGVVHGDVKLENVLVDKSGSVPRMVLCDFGMSRVYAPRLARQQLRVFDAAASMARSKSLFAERRPYAGDLPRARTLFADDSRVGILHLGSPHGPALALIDLLLDLSEYARSTRAPPHLAPTNAPPDLLPPEAALPHLHIGLLPYASPELLSPLPPPLGPSADIWAFGVLLYTLAVGCLPFQHLYEPRLRATIASGRYDHAAMRQACLTEWLLPQEPPQALSFVDMARQAQMAELRREWDLLDHNRFAWLARLVEGCLERDITHRWDLDMVVAALDGA